MRVIRHILYTYVVAIVLLCYISCFCGQMEIVFLPYTRMELVNCLEALWYACSIIWFLYYLTGTSFYVYNMRSGRKTDCNCGNVIIVYLPDDGFLKAETCS
jgi:hypothetical protein